MLSTERVAKVFTECIFGGESNVPELVFTEGITRSIAFHPDRLKGCKSEIEAMLLELPEDFRMSVGGGWSFRDANKDRHGNVWTETLEHVEQLLQLGMGIGKVICLHPRSQWDKQPGGMPYYAVIDRASD